MTDLDKLIADFKAEFEAGSRPDPAQLLARAEPGERAELADRLDAYLDSAPLREWDPEAFERSPSRQALERVLESSEGAAGTWPELLPALRKQARVLRSELVARLATAIGFSSEEKRVAGYYHQMEHGQIPAAGVSDKVLDALAAIVGTTPEKLREAGGRVSGADIAAGTGFARTAFPQEEYLMESRLSDAPAEPAARPAPSDTDRTAPGDGGRDELDKLFLGG